MHAYSTLGAAVPLSKDPVQVSPGCILASQGPLDIHHLLPIDCLLQSEWLVCSLFLTSTNGLFETLGWSNGHALRKTSSLLWVGHDVSLVSLVSELGCSVWIVSCENLVSPLWLLELLSLSVGDKDGSFGFLALSVIKLQGGVLLWI